MRKWILLVLASAAMVASAQQNPTVTNIVVRGNQNISVEAILASMRVKPGEPLTLSQLQADEQAIRDLGYFRDVKVLNRAVSETQSEVIVEVSEYPIVREVR
ncbi:MAG: POTRA domain-containing protein, partial [Fimbriimonadaceae bacterium]